MVDVVVINHDVDVLDALATAIESAGFKVAKRQAQERLDQLVAFVREQDPRVVVYDLGPPPVESAIEKWRDLCRQPGANRPYVITTTYACELAPHACMVECVLLKPMTLHEVTEAVHRAMPK